MKKEFAKKRSWPNSKMDVGANCFVRLVDRLMGFFRDENSEKRLKRLKWEAYRYRHSRLPRYSGKDLALFLEELERLDALSIDYYLTLQEIVMDRAQLKGEMIELDQKIIHLPAYRKRRKQE